MGAASAVDSFNANGRFGASPAAHLLDAYDCYCGFAPPRERLQRTTDHGREATIATGRPPTGRVSDIRLLGDFQGIVEFDSKVPDRIL